MPFQSLTDDKFLKLIVTAKKKSDPPTNLEKTCSVCDKHVINIATAVPCHVCQRFIHRKCAHLTEQQLIDFGVNIQQWLCKSCRDDVFPFNRIKNHEMLPDTFNSNEYCVCNDTTDLTDYDCLDTINELNLNKLDLNKSHPNIDNDIDHNLNFNCNFKYYTIHEFHKLCNKTN